ncbi:MAG: hypothetical protein LUD46_21390 [Parabacteroides sp.]|nr:hypothetical protein [Parabacteroides sp.]
MKRRYKTRYYILPLLALFFLGSVEGLGQEQKRTKVNFIDVTKENSEELRTIRQRNGIDPDSPEGLALIRELLKYDGISDEELVVKVEGIKQISSLRKTKWHERLDEKPAERNTEDTFDEKRCFFDSKEDMHIHNISQPSHVFIDSIYFIPGEEVDLWLPGFMYKSAGQSIETSSVYERWYNYRTGSVTFEDNVDLYFYKDGTASDNMAIQRDVTAYKLLMDM